MAVLIQSIESIEMHRQKRNRKEQQHLTDLLMEPGGLFNVLCITLTK